VELITQRAALLLQGAVREPAALLAQGKRQTRLQMRNLMEAVGTLLPRSPDLRCLDCKLPFSCPQRGSYRQRKDNPLRRARACG
jgi:hypothetical protein